MYEVEIARGVVALDRLMPDWRARLNPSRLDMMDPCCCVLGQVYGNFSYAPSELVSCADSTVACSFGFDLRRLSVDDSNVMIFERYERLTTEWRAELARPPVSID